MKKLCTLFSLIVCFIVVRAQNGEISGKITDENGEGIPFANVVIMDSKGVSTGRGTSSDMDGNYSLKPLSPGKYNVQYSYIGYTSVMEQGVVVNADKATFNDVKLKPSAKVLQEVEIKEYKVPLIDPGKTSSQNTVSSEEIANMATKNISDIAATTAGVFQSDQGGGLNIRGGRDEGTQYYVDGVKVTGVPTLPASSIEQLQVITGGVPAKYGDLTGGIINITSKGPSGQFNGGAEVQTTQGLDAYGYTLANANLTGPLWKQKKTKKTIIGFFGAFEYLHQKDPDPSAIGVWQVKPNVLDSLQRFPLLKKETSRGFNLRAEELTFADMFKQLVKPNTVSDDFRANGKIDIRPADNFYLTIGGSMAKTKSHSWVEQYTLLNSENNPLNNSLNWRVYGRFTHNIQSKQSEEDEKQGKKKKSSAFQNAFYSVQVDYEKYKVTYSDDSHGFNPFDYGYIGKFVTKRAPAFAFDTFAYGPTGHETIYRAFKQEAFQDTAVLFVPGNLNTNGTNFTTQYYKLLNAQGDDINGYEIYGQNNNGDNNTHFASTITDIQSNQGLINGTRSNIVNNIWYNTGRQYDGYGISADNDQYRVRLEGAFDILKPGAPSRNKHAFEFGVEYEQRIDRSYSVSPLSLWQRARELTNRQLAFLDHSNPVFVIDGVKYNVNDPNRPVLKFQDTILLERVYTPTTSTTPAAYQQSFFDKSLRKALGLPVNGTDYIDIDALKPSQLKLSMYSPEDLLADGASLVSYMGYDPYGNRLTSQPSFNDFFTKKDANGEMIRAIPAFRPIYTAAYISDRFYFKDLTFNIGVRFDRYDANEKVLKDPYTLYPVYDAAEAAQKLGVTNPANIGGNYAAYVDNFSNPKAIEGYRNGEVWYDRYGRELASGKVVADASSTGSIAPYTKDNNPINITDPTRFDPNGTFTDYKPKLVVMPRLQFSFNLTDKALFFAHYDILAQRPSGNVALPTQYLYFSSNTGGILANPNLKAQKTIDFELGFKQKVSNTSAFTISAFYREFRDQIQVRKYLDAFPHAYFTLDNIDFGTTKGFVLDYDMRRTGNISMKINYTMQFAEGTGSDATTQFNIVSATDANFRTISPLNYDSRHLINLNLSYSYGEGKDYNGPTVKNHQILSNSGISFQVAARSGTPYTEQSAVTPQGLLGQPGKPVSKGSINGSRLPWYFRVNMRIWKNFAFVVGKKEKKEGKRELSLQIYCQIQNLLNTQNVISVYRYTGVPNDDGYLNDPSSIAAIQAAVNPQAYKDQYAAVINRPSNYSLPRRIFLGAVFNF